jgi:S-adenosylmethionine/arginine decarboxylase-like enzyme
MAVKLNHLHMLGKAYLKNPPVNVEAANAWLETLVERINMKILMGPYSVDCQTVGNEGVTGAVVIETSHATFHCWHMVEKPFFMFDVYSCVEYDPKVVLGLIDEHFGLIDSSYMLIDRNGDTAAVIDQA